MQPMQGLGDTVEVVADLGGYVSDEGDGDTHLYLEDNGCGLVAEAMPNTIGMAECKAILPWQKRTPSRWKRFRVKVVGLRYYDHEHSTVAAGYNLEKSMLDHFTIEIHPVLHISKVP
jgi:hypothetical protein